MVGFTNKWRQMFNPWKKKYWNICIEGLVFFVLLIEFPEGFIKKPKWLFRWKGNIGGKDLLHNVNILFVAPRLKIKILHDVSIFRDINMIVVNIIMYKLFWALYGALKHISSLNVYICPNAYIFSNVCIMSYMHKHTMNTLILGIKCY